MNANLRHAALMGLEDLTRQVERDTNTTQIWDDIKPYAEQMVADFLPATLELHPALVVLYQVGRRLHQTRQKQL